MQGTCGGVARETEAGRDLDLVIMKSIIVLVILLCTLYVTGFDAFLGVWD